MILHQFPSSHYNEKARWALDYKQIAHERISYLPGPHVSKIKNLTGGKQSSTPVLEADTIISGSAAIIDFLEQRYPDHPLYPAKVEERTAAFDWQTRLDESLGPAVRTVVFAIFVEEPGFLTKTFAGKKLFLTRLGYRAMLPMVMPIIKKANGADSEENIQACQTCVDQYLNEIAETVETTGYLVGDAFSVADLTAASLLAPLTRQSHPDMKRPEPVPQTMLSLINAYAMHPAIVWVQRMYQQHRADLNGSRVMSNG